METLLTLVIAVGGIATGIGAIWTAVAARRQAQLTERSLTEHNERLRLNLEVDLLHRMQGRYDSQLFIGRRSAAARYFLDNAFVDDNMVEVERLNDAATDVCDFFESLAYLQSIDALSAKSVWNNFSGDVRLHWAMCKSGIEKMREERQDPTLRRVRTAFPPDGRHGPRARHPRPHARTAAPSPGRKSRQRRRATHHRDGGRASAEAPLAYPTSENTQKAKFIY